MSQKTDDENGRWNQVKDNFDLLFAQLNDFGIIQQELKKDISATQEEQQLISKQVQANGQAMASLTLRQMESEAKLDHSDTASHISLEDITFENVFAEPTKDPKPETSKKPVHHNNHHHPTITTTQPKTSTTTQKAYPIMPYLKCNFQLLMAKTPRSGLTSVTTTSISTRSRIL